MYDPPLPPEDKATAQEKKRLEKALKSLEHCLATEFLTDEERSNLEEAVFKLKQFLAE